MTAREAAFLRNRIIKAANEISRGEIQGGAGILEPAMWAEGLELMDRTAAFLDKLYRAQQEHDDTTDPQV